MDAVCTTLAELPAELRSRAEARCAGFMPPPIRELPDLERAEIFELSRESSGLFEQLEGGIMTAASIHGAFDLAIAEGLLALTGGDRLLQLGVRLDDYARERLDLQPRTTMKRVRLAEQLRDLPLLREALRVGEVSLRAAEVVAPVAKGDGELGWVERASTDTIRALEAQVKQLRPSLADALADAEQEDEFGRLSVGATPDELAVIGEALERASQELPDSKPFQQLEAMAQEYLGGHPEAAPEASPLPSRELFRGPAPLRPDLEEGQKIQLEAETERWSTLEPRRPWIPPAIRWYDVTSVEELDASLRLLVELRAAWDRLLGWAGFELKRARVYRLQGFASFRHYVAERLGLPPRAVEQRVALEGRIRESAALRRAREEQLSLERLRALAHLRLDDAALATWIPRARELSVIALRYALEDEERGQMRARRRFTSAVNLPVAGLLAAAVQAVRSVVGEQLSTGKCLAVIARHYLEVHGPPRKPKTCSQKIRARDRWRCKFPRCSHPAEHAHHTEFLSQGGARTDPGNLSGLCAFHHHAIHHGYVTLEGTAPDGLVWRVGGRLWPEGPWPG
jgi:hypothetical protein